MDFEPGPSTKDSDVGENDKSSSDEEKVLSTTLSNLDSKTLACLHQKILLNDGSLGKLIDDIRAEKEDKMEDQVIVLSDDEEEEPQSKKMKLDDSVEEIEDGTQNAVFLSTMFPQLSLDYIQAKIDETGDDPSKLQAIIDQIIEEQGIGSEDQDKQEEVVNIEEDEKNNSEKLFMKFKTMFPNIPVSELQDKALEITLDINKNVETVTEELIERNEDYGKQKIEITTFSDDVVPDEDDHESLAFLEKARTIFRTLLNKMELPEVKNPDNEIESIKIIKNSKLTEDYQKTMINFISRGIVGVDGELEELYLFHGTKEESLKSIIKNNFQLDAVPINQHRDAQHRVKGQVYGKGIYFTEYPGLGLSYGNALILCKVLLGKCQQMDMKDDNARKEIQEGWHSKKLNNKKYDGYVYVIKEASQVLPVGIITLKNKDIFNDIYKRNNPKKALMSGLQLIGPGRWGLTHAQGNFQGFPQPIPPGQGQGNPQGQGWVNPLANFRFPWQGQGGSNTMPAVPSSSQMVLRPPVLGPPAVSRSVIVTGPGPFGHQKPRPGPGAVNNPGSQGTVKLPTFLASSPMRHIPGFGMLPLPHHPSGPRAPHPSAPTRYVQSHGAPGQPSAATTQPSAASAQASAASTRHLSHKELVQLLRTPAKPSAAPTQPSEVLTVQQLGALAKTPAVANSHPPSKPSSSCKRGPAKSSTSGSAPAARPQPVPVSSQSGGSSSRPTAAAARLGPSATSSSSSSDSCTKQRSSSSSDSNSRQRVILRALRKLNSELKQLEKKVEDSKK